MGYSRARTVTQTEGAQLVAVCDLIDEKCQRAAAEFGCDTHRDYLEMLDRDDLDVAYVMTPSGRHADMGMEAARRGKHVLTTKPMDVTPAKCDALIAACAEAGVQLLVDYEERYREANRKLKKALEMGLLGPVILGEIRLKWYRAPSYYEGWHGTWALDGGGSAMNQGVHQIDLLQWFLGPATAAYGRMGVYGHDNVETEDLTVGLIDFASGALGVVLTTTTFVGEAQTTVEVHGTAGAVVTDRGPAQWTLQGREVPEIELEPSPASAAEDMVWVLTRGTAPACDGREGRKAVELVCAFYESARRGEKVALLGE
jgi:predicted dehydrogenase